jgi:hypothetical protein
MAKIGVLDIYSIINTGSLLSNIQTARYNQLFFAIIVTVVSVQLYKVQAEKLCEPSTGLIMI